MPTIQYMLKLRNKFASEMKKQITKLVKGVVSNDNTLSILEEALDLLVATKGISKADIKLSYIKPNLDWSNTNIVYLRIPFKIILTHDKNTKGSPNLKSALEPWIKEHTTQGSTVFIIQTSERDKNNKSEISGIYTMKFLLKEFLTIEDNTNAKGSK